MHLTLTPLIVLASILTVFLWYTLMRWIGYLRGKFQYSPYYPKHYIFPKRITREIRKDIIQRFKRTKVSNLHVLEEELYQHLAKMKINTTDRSMSSKELYQYKIGVGENSFRYFLYLHQACVITGLIRTSAQVNANIAWGKLCIKDLNNLVMTRHCKRIISNTDRSVILAEIIWRAIGIIKPVDCKFPYNYDFYKTTRREGVILTHKALIEAALNDDAVIQYINIIHLSYNPIYIGSDKGGTLMLVIYICLLTNWLKE